MGETRHTTYRKGEAIYDAGSRGGDLFKVCSGAVMLYTIDDDGGRQIIDLAGPGDLLHFELDGIVDHFAEALTETEIMISDGAGTLSDPAARAFFVDQMRDRLAMERQHITMLGRRTAQERLEVFLDYAAERMNSAPGHVELPMTRQQIADFLGLTLETVSRIFARWLREDRLHLVAPKTYRYQRSADGIGVLARAAA